uniref:F-box/LRR-repeat protein 14 n=1 Tax=Cacopsylla melanoneura TaxID=428564 RepID=A0A8D9AG51_9HEMI
MNEYFTSVSPPQPLYYPTFKKRNHGHYYLYQPHLYVTSAPVEPQRAPVEKVAPTQPEEPQGTQMNALYPEILAIVFSYLPVADKGRACQVCKKWYNTIYQYKSLWKNIEAKIHLSNNSYNNKIMMKSIIKSIVKRNITRIQILSTNNNNINLLFKNNYMIRSLNLSGLYNLNDNIILNLIIVNMNLNKFNHLTHLNLSLCKLLTDNSLMYICESMNRLTDLNVSGCNLISNYSLQVIYKHLSELKHLNLKSLWLINDVGIGYLCGIGVDPPEEDGEESSSTLNTVRRRQGLGNNLNELIKRVHSRSSGVQTESPSGRSESSTGRGESGRSSNHFQAENSRNSDEINRISTSSSGGNASSSGEPTPCHSVPKLPRKYLTAHLETLILQDCQRITDEGIKVISQSMTSLRHLNLSFCINISDNCFKYINKMPQLNELILRSCNITDTGIEYLNSNLDNLTTLDLCFCESITDRTLQHITVYILNLKHLYMSHCHITDVGLSRLSKTMFHLENLYLGQCHSITDASIIQLIKSTTVTTVSTSKTSSFISGEASNSSDLVRTSSTSSSDLYRTDSRSSPPDSERRLKYLDVYGCKLINHYVLLKVLGESNSNIVINFGL